MEKKHYKRLPLENGYLRPLFVRPVNGYFLLSSYVNRLISLGGCAIIDA